MQVLWLGNKCMLNGPVLRAREFAKCLVLGMMTQALAAVANMVVAKLAATATVEIRMV
jgi:hypothetical protein